MINIYVYDFFLGFYNYYLWFVLVKNRNKIIAQKYREIKKTFHTLIRNNKNLRKQRTTCGILFSSFHHI